VNWLEMKTVLAADDFDNGCSPEQLKKLLLRIALRRLSHIRMRRSLAQRGYYPMVFAMPISSMCGHCQTTGRWGLPVRG